VQQLYRLALLAASYLKTFAFSEQGCRREPGCDQPHSQATFDV